MSWSVNIVGKSENVIQKLNDYSEKFKDESKKEYDDALPHLVAIVKQNFDNNSDNRFVKVEASGHGYSLNGATVSRSLNVLIQNNYGDVV